MCLVNEWMNGTWVLPCANSCTYFHNQFCSVGWFFFVSLAHDGALGVCLLAAVVVLEVMSLFVNGLDFLSYECKLHCFCTHEKFYLCSIFAPVVYSRAYRLLSPTSKYTWPTAQKSWKCVGGDLKAVKMAAGVSWILHTILWLFCLVALFLNHKRPTSRFG